ncbi:uncharacterized protein G2W53_014560 [Senna tora]|uniref:Uncharacterized protein n=1 Tax=Senna tora TaxID=362788 RepID=A0A834WTW1_9FABA|nr:uncharacterized protein G2W53_014560 [Senna tora]
MHSIDAFSQSTQSTPPLCTQSTPSHRALNRRLHSALNRRLLTEHSIDASTLHSIDASNLHSIDASTEHSIDHLSQPLRPRATLSQPPHATHTRYAHHPSPTTSRSLTPARHPPPTTARLPYTIRASPFANHLSQPQPHVLLGAIRPSTPFTQRNLTSCLQKLKLILSISISLLYFTIQYLILGVLIKGENDGTPIFKSDILSIHHFVCIGIRCKMGRKRKNSPEVMLEELRSQQSNTNQHETQARQVETPSPPSSDGNTTPSLDGIESLPKEKDDPLLVQIIDTTTKEITTQKMTAKEVWHLDKNVKVMVELNGDGQGDDNGSNLLVRFLGKLARNSTLCPIHIENWKLVPRDKKAQLWKLIEKLAARNTTNRKKLKVSHASGSKSNASKASQMAKKLGRPICRSEVVLSNLIKKNGTYVNEEAETLALVFVSKHWSFGEIAGSLVRLDVYPGCELVIPNNVVSERKMAFKENIRYFSFYGIVAS